MVGAVMFKFSKVFLFSIKTAVVSRAKMNQGTTVLLVYAIDTAFKFKLLLALVRRLRHAVIGADTQCYICAPHTHPINTHQFGSNHTQGLNSESGI